MKTEELPNIAEAILPVAEIFTSFQGEGTWTGTRMTFIRLAGCNVGKPYTRTAQEALGLQVYQERCTDAFGNGFPCDTNYRMAAKFSPDEIVEQVPSNVRHVVLTGGEPLMHKYTVALLQRLAVAGKQIHIETSGTKPFSVMGPWVTVSPKHGYLKHMLERADELKILVGVDFNEAIFVNAFLPWVDRKPVWLSPINGENTLDQDNMARCVQLQERYPDLRITTQLHKIFGVR